MAHDPFGAYAFNPETLRVLYAVFDAAWKKVEQRTPAEDREGVRDAIAQAVVALAQSRQRAPTVAELETYAVEQALAAAGLPSRTSYSVPLLH